MERRKLKKILGRCGRNLKQLRKSKKLSYRKLAALCAVDAVLSKKY
jgi:hypothetical protein